LVLPLTPESGFKSIEFSACVRLGANLMASSHRESVRFLRDFGAVLLRKGS
jgi:hypothetical protein